MNEYFENLKENLKQLIKIPSVKSTPKEGKPFGEEVARSLEFFLSLASDMGFETINYDNYIGEVIFGEGEEDFGILCHLDVVPTGSLAEWKHPPFSAVEEDGKIYGRGTTDDKGPAMVCLYCLKALKDEGFKPSKKIKLILGCDEESGWGCIDHYKKVAKLPDVGFSPDADFPVLYAEKGILHAKFFFEIKEGLKYISGGDRVNVVCDKCEAIAPLNANLMQKYGLKSEDEKVYAIGKTAHGSMPEKGINAILPVLSYLEQIGVIDGRAKTYLFDDALGLKNLEDDTGKLTMSPNVIKIEDEKLAISVDIRYPSTKNGDDIMKELEKIAPFKVLSHQLPLYNNKEGKLVTTLLNIFNEVTGSNLKPMAIGGGTYARALKVGTAFGPEMPGEESTVHQPNEYVSVKNLALQFEIYKKAIKELTE